jgi:hypothetical protein
MAVDRLQKTAEWKQRMTELKPGLELDKMIARKILGWREWSQAARVKPYDRSKWWDKDNSELVYLNRFSIDIRAAWVLVEKFKLCVVPWETGWTAFRPGQIFVDGERNMAPTAPHAICLAALFYASGDNE